MSAGEKKGEAVVAECIALVRAAPEPGILPVLGPGVVAFIQAWYGVRHGEQLARICDEGGRPYLFIMDDGGDHPFGCMVCPADWSDEEKASYVAGKHQQIAAASRRYGYEL